MANSTVCKRKWKPIAEPRQAKPKKYRQATTHRLKFYEEAVIESEARTAVVQFEKWSIAINNDWFDNQACSLPHNMQAIANYFITVEASMRAEQFVFLQHLKLRSR